MYIYIYIVDLKIGARSRVTDTKKRETQTYRETERDTYREGSERERGIEETVTYGQRQTQTYRDG